MGKRALARPNRRMISSRVSLKFVFLDRNQLGMDLKDLLNPL